MASTADLDWTPYVERTDGASPAYIKEFLRQAVLLAAEAGRADAHHHGRRRRAMDEPGRGWRARPAVARGGHAPGFFAPPAARLAARRRVPDAARQIIWPPG